MRIQDRQSEGEGEEDPGQPAGKLDQHIGGLRAENIFGHATAKGRAQSFALWTLHQNDQQQQKRDQKVNREQEVNQDLHRGRAIWLNATQKQPHFLLISFQIESISSRSTLPSFFPRARSSSSNKLNRPTNLSVADCSAVSASSLHLRARLTTAKSKSPISSSVDSRSSLSTACFNSPSSSSTLAITSRSSFQSKLTGATLPCAVCARIRAGKAPGRLAR